MNRYAKYGQLDDAPKVTGDAGFTRLDILTDPAMLPAGTLSICENMRFDNNGTTVRAGMSRQFPAGDGITQIYGAAVFKPAADEDYIAFVTATYLCLFNLTTQAFNYVMFPSGQTIEDTDAVNLVQGGVGMGTLPQIYILRGVNKSVLQYDGNTNSIAVASTLSPLTHTVNAGFAPGSFALFYQDRMAVVAGQNVMVSDFLDFTNFTLLNQFQILKGGNDYLQCLLAYQGDYVLVGTRQGWYIAYFDPSVGTGGYLGGVSDTSFLRHLTQEAGPVGPDAALEAMGLIWFIAAAAVYAFQPQLDNQLVVLGKPLSADIQPIMDRMCLAYSQGASIERYGYRLYFAWPISDAPLMVSDITSQLTTVSGLTLPFTLPTLFYTNTIATVTTGTTPHNLATGDRVQLTGSANAGLNGEFPVYGVVDNFNFQVAFTNGSSLEPGAQMYAQRLATRNNCIGVYNLNNKAWESIDWLPTGIYADWLLPVEHASQRRLVVVDQDQGPFLYEDGDADEVGTVLGGIRLPFTLDVVLSAANYASQPITGRLVTRSFRWGAGSDVWTGSLTNQSARKVRHAEVRATLDSNSALTLTLNARTPNYRLWSASRAFTAAQFQTADAPLRKLCGERALEAQVEIDTNGGRPTIRSIAIETADVGRDEE